VNEHPERKVVQLVHQDGLDGATLLALCDDGTIWSYESDGDDCGWEEIPGPPGTISEVSGEW
jgi:hypothetical protein